MVEPVFSVYILCHLRQSDNQVLILNEKIIIPNLLKSSIFSETLINIYQTTRCHIAEDNIVSYYNELIMMNEMGRTCSTNGGM
jgi:hypothetical protein